MDLTKKDLVMTSRELAELTNKEHKNVIRDIRVEKEKLEMEGISNELIFEMREYKDSTGRTLPQYIINEKGIKLLVRKYRNLKDTKLQEFLVKHSIIVDFIHTSTRFEVSFLNLLEEALFEIDVFGIKQFNVNGYRVDFYIPELKLAVEYDEQQHNYMEKQDLDRQLIISKELDCEFIRCDYKESDIKNVMNVLKKINFGGNK